MNKEQLIKNKEMYRLWYEYLKFDLWYKNYCEAKRCDSDFLVPVNKLNNKLRTILYPMSLSNYYSDIFYQWGNVFEYSFEEIFSEFQKRLSSKKKQSSFTSQVDLYIKKYKKSHKEEPTAKQIRDFLHELELPFVPIPTRKVSDRELNCLERYLKIWKAIKIEGLSLQDAVNKIDPQGNIHKKKSAMKAWRRDVLFAKRIILNAGRGEFPGNYQKVE
jgi:hypothetical protein